MIRDDIVVTVVDVRGDCAQLGIDAPSEVPVHRREIYERIKESERAERTGREDSTVSD